MNGTWATPDVGRIPLFDRLVDEEPYHDREEVPLRTLGRAHLIESVRREIERLLSTRCPVRGDVALTRPRTVLDYGLPDLEQGGRSVVTEQRPRLARLVRETIEAFEPRITNLRVDIQDTGGGKSRIVVLLEANLILDEEREAISFTLPLGPGGSSER
jgi:type VI secretion system protein ImpF